MSVEYVEAFAAFCARSTGSKRRIELFGGDCGRVLDATGLRSRVRARGMAGHVDPAQAGDRSLRAVCFIDVGQGDGILFRTT